MVFAIILIVTLSVSTIMSMASSDHCDGDASMVNIVYHQNCKTKGGCGKTCPFIKPDDPRLVISEELMNVRNVYENVKQSIKDDTELVSDTLAKIEVEDSEKSILKTTLDGIIGSENQSKQKLSLIVNHLRSIDVEFSDRDVINVDMIKAKNRAIILASAAVIQKNCFTASHIHLRSVIMMNYIINLNKDQHKHITNFDEQKHRAVVAAGNANNTTIDSILTIYNNLRTSSTTYDVAISAAATASATSENIITNLAASLNEAQRTEDLIIKSTSRLREVVELYNACSKVRESFSNDLPGKMSANNVTDLIEASDYETAIIKTALESDIVSNHKKFSKERASFEGGGSIQSVRDDDNDIVPWVGLFGRPTYRKSNGTSAETSKEVLKSIPSEYPEQLMRKSSMRLGTKTY